ncbi:prephenate dehydrogenase/arogenate dehydrogenase family protein [Ferroplasma sp.]|uniref:prephenate dehydrogenase/arogenate dehydrogenase family protein n=1 Tax=Ferroplasma sp. TaxID=2591003 RepID=UPI0026088CE2|nr:prephenate dehydrogenase/arogenate dehydrogenase family protein [Ferroplasma sp.]
MRLLVMGSNGRLGKTLMKIFPDAHGIDIENSYHMEAELKEADFAFLALPVEATLNFIKRFPEYEGFIDLTSVKSKMTSFSRHIISLHPLFGPESYEKNKSIIFINDISRINSLDDIKNMFPGYNIISMDAEEHDTLMGEILVKPYILSYISESRDSDIVTGSYSKFLEIEKIKYKENPGVFIDTIKYNNNSRGIINEIEKKLQDLKKLIGD